MSQITTEITSSSIASDNPLHQRLLYAYHAACPHLQGHVLEVGCGEGRGLEIIQPFIKNYTALDKNTFLLDQLKQSFPSYQFLDMTFPPFHGLEDESFDTVVAFQVIEHIAQDQWFVQEIKRVLKPGGKALISTPNKHKSLTRNPWHEREYSAQELKHLLANNFSKVETFGITGSQKVWDYYELNKASVRKITRFDIFDLQYKLPASWLRAPYDYLNRRNRNKMMEQDQSLVHGIALEDYFLSEKPEETFDLFYIASK